MRALLDTHIFLWWIMDHPRLSSRHREIISNGENELYISAASAWEIAIKANLGKIELPENPDKFLLDQAAINAFHLLPVLFHHALGVYRLERHHRDPFDRLLVAQSILEDLPILTDDPSLKPYGIEIIG